MDKIIGDIDLDTLQSLLDQVTFCKLNPSISAPRSSNGDSLAIKGMMIQQLIVEYLLNVQESINTSESSLKEELRAAAHHVADLDDQLNRLGARNKSQKREVRHCLCQEAFLEARKFFQPPPPLLALTHPTPPPTPTPTAQDVPGRRQDLREHAHLLRARQR